MGENMKEYRRLPKMANRAEDQGENKTSHLGPEEAGQ
jgi:hypothetical protein